jgi:hypothetical protein
MPQPKRFLIRHVGNMGDMVFFVPPILETLKKRYPDCHITFVTAWGYKKKGSRLTLEKIDEPRTSPFQSLWRRRVARRAKWGERNQGGFSIALMMTNPHIDQLVHWHDTVLDLDSTTCQEEGRQFPTWNKKYFAQQKQSGAYDAVWELDFGLTIDDDPVRRMYEAIGLPQETLSNYKLYFTEQDKAIAAAVMQDKPQPRIVLLESLKGANTRGWDTEKVPLLEQAIRGAYNVEPLWFGGQYIPQYEGTPLTLRQNIATLKHADVAIGVLSGPLHFAAAVGLPTITLYGDQPLHRAAPAYFLNEYITSEAKKHRTLVGPTPSPITFLKSASAPAPLSPREATTQGYEDWLRPGRQATKSCLAPITVDEIMAVLHDMLKKV